MDPWLESPLNKAHFYERRANVLVKSLCFDEAIECHISAANLLSESYKVTDNEKAKVSIQLQKDYHLKQKDFLRVKKLQYQAFKEVMRVQKEAMLRMINVRDGNVEGSSSETEEISLQKAIYKTLTSELMTKVTASEKKVESLKEKVAELEAENRRLGPVKAITSAVPTPFAFSPGELPPTELPTLAPLEMPDFDLSVLHKKYQSCTSQNNQR